MRCAVIGLGWAADSFHLPALQGTPGVEVVGGCDTDAERRDRFVAKTGAPAFDTTAELFERARPDAVVVATPPDSHRALCLEALAAGAHVICEKPFVETVEDADAVLAAAATAGRQVAINHQYREKPIFRAVRDRIGTKDVGRLVFMPVHAADGSRAVGRAGRVAAGDAEPDPLRGRRAPRRPDADHDGEPPVAVYARSSSGLDGTRAADAIHLVLLEFPGGRLAQITIDRLCKAGTRYVELRADCEHASLRASYGGRRSSRRGSSGRNARDPPRLRARRRRLDRARDVAQDDRPQSAASGGRRDADPLREDPRGVRRGARAALERTRGADASSR